MPNYSKNDIVLIRYPFSDLSNSKVRPAIVVNAKHISQDILIVPLTSKTSSLWISYSWCSANYRNFQVDNWWLQPESSQYVMKEINNLVKFIKEGQLIDIEVEL